MSLRVLLACLAPVALLTVALTNGRPDPRTPPRAPDAEARPRGQAPLERAPFAEPGPALSGAVEDRSTVGPAPLADAAGASTRTPDRRAPIEAVMVRARVVEHGGGGPLGDVTVTLRSGGASRTATTDADGYVAFRPPAAPAKLVADAPEGWLAPPALTLQTAHLEGRARALITLERARNTHFTLRDARTDEPIPHCALVVLHRPGATAAATSDAEGGLELDLGRATPRVQLVDWPGATPLANARVDGDAIVATIGPTYRLRFGEPRSVQGLVATLLAPHVRARRMPPTVPVRSDSTREHSRSAWVRFRREVDPEASLLEIRSADGLAAATLEVEGVVGVQPRALDVRFEPRGRLVGRVVGEPPASLRVVLERLFELEGDGDANDPDDRNGALARRAPRRLEPDGSFAFQWLPAGRYRVRTEGSGAPCATVALVDPGSTATVELALDEPKGDAVISGVVHWRGGPAAGGVFVTARAVDDPRDVHRAKVATSDSAGEGRFRFDGLARASYELRVEARLRTVDPPTRVVRAPSEDVGFTVDTGAITENLGFAVVDADSGEPIERFRARVDFVDAGRHQSGAASSGALFARDVPVDSPVRWTVAAPGYEHAFGDRADFVERAGRTGLLLAPVALRRGWSRRLIVRDAHGHPFAGAEIALDGLFAGRTGGDGALVVHAPAEPGELVVTHAGATLLTGRYSTIARSKERDGTAVLRVPR